MVIINPCHKASKHGGSAAELDRIEVGCIRISSQYYGQNRASADHGMTLPLEIVASEIIALEGTQFQRLLNRLLEIEVSQVGLPVNALAASDEVNVPDGGIDARISAPGFSGNEFLPTGSSIWQVKAGKSGFPNYKDELNKEDVKRAILEGSTYVMVLGRVVNSSQQDRECERVRVAISAIKPEAPFELRSASQMASWVTRYPALWRHLGRSTFGLWNVKEFLNQQPQLVLDYVWSSETESLRDAILARLTDPGFKTHLRVHGRTGVGKTRFVLEAFAGSNHVAVHAPNASDDARAALKWMCQRLDMTATLIVDECNIPDAQQLAINVNGARGKINLITIGANRLPEPQDQFEIDPMSDVVLRAVVQETYPQLQIEQLLWIVEKTRGFVKLARRLAEKAMYSQIDMTTIGVPELLGELFTEEEQAALTVVALCTYVGWKGELEREGRALSDHLGLEWRKCKWTVRQLEKRGYIGRAGRYRYVTPELLAIWLAAEEWATHRSHLREVLIRTTPDVAERMSKRLRTMPPIDEVVELATEVLRPDGPFRDLAALNQPRLARFFSDFSGRLLKKECGRMEVVLSR